MTRLYALLFGTALVAAPMAVAAEINISYSDEFAETLEEDYGMREGERLMETVRKDLEQALERQGVDVAQIDVTINDAKPNRPTLQQVSDQPGLDMFRSISIGGMDLTAMAYDGEGNLVAEVQYDWYENNIRDVIGASTWWDAGRASDRFSRRLAKQLPGAAS
ncbi:MAG: hypothetical protein GVY06_06540 [Alphaproteobacteria bacterium]|jgi:hypothetical protein|nr:hypothetical protein [Alphaproteobacteria bacterium]